MNLPRLFATEFQQLHSVYMNEIDNISIENDPAIYQVMDGFYCAFDLRWQHAITAVSMCRDCLRYAEVSAKNAGYDIFELRR